MPGIIPTVRGKNAVFSKKLIKTGSSARIAQACDRCRSKKIRCDGLQPSCTNCINVGFHCVTSDKLSRRAFPRGYTESLEQLVRQFEREVAELKSMLEEKDEQLKKLSGASSSSSESRKDEAQEKLFDGDPRGEKFVELLRRKANLAADGLVPWRVSGCEIESEAPMMETTSELPSRLQGDEYVRHYFAATNSLLPILDMELFLTEYEMLYSSGEASDHAKAQLYLVFAIAMWERENRNGGYDQVWETYLNKILWYGNRSTLRALLLAQTYCTMVGRLEGAWTYNTLSTSMVKKLPVVPSDDLFNVTFFSDALIAALLGLPRNLASVPRAPSSPESSPLFQLGAILAKVTDTLQGNLSHSAVGSLSLQLKTYQLSLPDMVSRTSPAPLVAFMFNFTRMLLYRPALSASPLRASSLLEAVDSAKCLLEMAVSQSECTGGNLFAFAGTSGVLFCASCILLYAAMDYPQGGALKREVRRMVDRCAEILSQWPRGGKQAESLQMIANAVLGHGRASTDTEGHSMSPSNASMSLLSPSSDTAGNADSEDIMLAAPLESEPFFESTETKGDAAADHSSFSSSDKPTSVLEDWDSMSVACIDIPGLSEFENEEW